MHLSRRWLLAAGVFIVVAGATAVIAVAETQDAGPPTVTGCLTQAGDLRDFAVGQSPDRACKSSDTQLQLSGGDITSVVAGTGLEGGANSGAALLSIAQQFRLPVDCAGGDTARWSAALQYWTCAPVFEPHTFAAYRQVPFTIDAPRTVLTLHLPPGNYIVSTHLLITNDSGLSHVRCRTSPTIGAPASGLVLTDLNVGNTNGAVGAGTLAGSSPAQVAPGADIAVSCQSLAGAFGTFPVVRWGAVMATSVVDFTAAEDSSTGQYGG